MKKLNIYRTHYLFCTLLIFVLPKTLPAQLSGFITEDTTFTIANSPYSIDGDLFIGADVTVTIDPGVTFQLKANNDEMSGGDNPALSEIIVYGTLICEGTADSLITFKSYFGSNTAGEWGQIMTDLDGRIFIQFAEIKHSYNGINIYESAPMDLRIENCIFQDIEGTGILITSSNIGQSFTSGNSFTAVGRAIISYRTNNHSSHNVITGGGDGIESPGNSTVISNEISNLSGIACKVSGYSHVINNDIIDIGGKGIYLYGSYFSIIGNNITNVGGGYNPSSIYGEGCRYANIYGNYISNSNEYAIYLSDGNTDLNLVFNNIIDATDGIRVYQGDFNEIMSNTINSSNGNGISFYQSDVSEIFDNIITGSSSYGISQSASTILHDYNNVWNSGPGNYSGLSAGVNSISVNPYYTNPSVGDFTLQAGSPCLVMGENGGQMGAYGGFRETNTTPIFDYVDLDDESNNFFADQSFDILWTASDIDGDDVSVYLYWDSDTDTTHMTGIGYNLSNTGSHSWNTSRMNPGSYYIYAVAYDYKLGRVSKYSAAQVIIDHESYSEESPANLSAYPQDQSIQLNWDIPQSGNPEHYVVYQSTVSGFYPVVTDSIAETNTPALEIAGLTNGVKYYYRVAARGSNSSLSGFTNEATATPQSVTIQIGSESSAPGAEVSIPISVSDLTGQGVVSYQYTINYDSEFLVLNSITTTNCITSGWTNLSTNISGSTATIWHSGASPLSGSGNLINLEFAVNSNATPGASTEISITDILINEGTPQFNSFNGSYSVFPAFSISGNAQYFMGAHPIEGVTLSLTGATSTTVTSDGLGNYVLPSIQGGWSYEVEATNTGILSQAISAYDAALILRHIAEIETLSSDQLIAADVSGDGSASSADASNIGQWGVGLISEFPRGEAWYFSPEVISLDPLTQDTSTINFTGIAYGDVSGNWENQVSRDPDLMFTLDSNRSTIVDNPNQYVVSLSEPLAMEIDDKEYFVYDIRTNTNEGILAFTLRFDLDGGDQNNVEFFPSENFANNLSISNYNKDHLIITSAGIYPANTPDQNIGKVFLNRSSSRSWGELVLTSAEINETPAVLGSALNLEQSGIINIKEFNLYQNYPNPFNASTLIKYDVPMTTKVSVIIYDLKGEQISALVENSEHRAGAYSVLWEGKNDHGADVPSGLYMYRFSSNNYSKTGKLLLLK
jgi:hypothetical protein